MSGVGIWRTATDLGPFAKQTLPRIADIESHPPNEPVADTERRVPRTGTTRRIPGAFGDNLCPPQDVSDLRQPHPDSTSWTYEREVDTPF